MSYLTPTTQYQVNTQTETECSFYPDSTIMSLEVIDSLGKFYTIKALGKGVPPLVQCSLYKFFYKCYFGFAKV